MRIRVVRGRARGLPALQQSISNSTISECPKIQYYFPIMDPCVNHILQETSQQLALLFASHFLCNSVFLQKRPSLIFLPSKTSNMKRTFFKSLQREPEKCLHLTLLKVTDVNLWCTYVCVFSSLPETRLNVLRYLTQFSRQK